MIKFIVHDEPVGRARSSYIAMADLAPFGLDGQKEQLWLEQLNDGTFSIACIPFRAYGLALGDRVILSEAAEIAKVVAVSQHRVLRLLFDLALPPAELASAADRIKTGITMAGLLSEWSGDRHVAVDVPPHTDTSKLFEVMGREVTEGRAFWEWADVEPFSTVPR